MRVCWGGLCIGCAAAALLLFDGSIAGVSGLADRALGLGGDAPWALAPAFTAGLLLGALFFSLANGPVLVRFPTGIGPLVAVGLLVGFGTRLASGCTQRTRRLRALLPVRPVVGGDRVVHGGRFHDRGCVACDRIDRVIRRALVALASGVLFGIGLALSGMADPERVRALLTIGSGWDPTLAFVMVGAILPMALAWMVKRHLTKPLADTGFHVPASTPITSRIVVGSLVFGVGWGNGRPVPRPGVGRPGARAWPFVMAMVAVFALVSSRCTRGAALVAAKPTRFLLGLPTLAKETG